MALTKVEAAKLTQDLMVRGVMDTIVRDSPLFQMLPFMDVVGSAVTYNREATNPAASFYDVGDTWTEATPISTASCSRPMPIRTISRLRSSRSGPRRSRTSTAMPSTTVIRP
jgi:hypothetical protein